MANHQIPEKRLALLERFASIPTHPFETDLDGSGRFDVQRHFLRFNIIRPISPQWIISLGLSLDYEYWRFSDIGELTGIDLWDEIVRPGVNASIIYNTTNGSRLMFIPFLESAGATGAEMSEPLSYGAVLAAMYSLSISFSAERSWRKP